MLTVFLGYFDPFGTFLFIKLEKPFCSFLKMSVVLDIYSAAKCISRKIQMETISDPK